ncbi:hypothetical protein [Rheinheimera sp.]|uniref:hypothetical protein n=1 Tax=Rheinheimera sp. TaxID=1869214 RepID=UPI00307F33E0
MSQLLQFLTSLGSSAELRSLNADQLQQKMQEQGLSQQEMAVILSGDRNAIAQLVRTNGDIVCCIIVPDDQEDESEDDSEESKQEIKFA